eukprot:15366972-Ditylum_brightwellii.AAC.1
MGVNPITESKGKTAHILVLVPNQSKTSNDGTVVTAVISGVSTSLALTLVYPAVTNIAQGRDPLSIYGDTDRPTSDNASVVQSIALTYIGTHLGPAPSHSFDYHSVLPIPLAISVCSLTEPAKSMPAAIFEISVVKKSPIVHPQNVARQYKKKR